MGAVQTRRKSHYPWTKNGGQVKLALLEWRMQSHRSEPTDFVFPSRTYGGHKALDLAAVLKRKIRQEKDW